MTARRRAPPTLAPPCLALLAVLAAAGCPDNDVLLHDECVLDQHTGIFEVFADLCLTQFAGSEVFVQGDLDGVNFLYGFTAPLPLFVGRTFSSPLFDENADPLNPTLIGAGDFEVLRITEVSNGAWRVDLDAYALADPCCFDGELAGLLSVDTLSEVGLEP